MQNEWPEAYSSICSHNQSQSQRIDMFRFVVICDMIIIFHNSAGIGNILFFALLETLWLCL